MEVKVVKGDLLQQNVEVIVNSWNRNIIPWWLLVPQGVSGAIKKSAGNAPFKELGSKGAIPLGGAVKTTAGRLPFKAIIHVASINLFWLSSDRAIQSSVKSAMKIAKENNYRSLAFPLIGAGVGGVKDDKVRQIIEWELSQIAYDGEVRIVRYEKHTI